MLFPPGPGYEKPTLQTVTRTDFESSSLIVLPTEGGYVRFKTEDGTWFVQSCEGDVYTVPFDIIDSDLQQWLVSCAKDNEGYCTRTSLNHGALPTALCPLMCEPSLPFAIHPPSALCVHSPLPRCHPAAVLCCFCTALSALFSVNAFD